MITPLISNHDLDHEADSTQVLYSSNLVTGTGISFLRCDTFYAWHSDPVMHPSMTPVIMACGLVHANITSCLGVFSSSFLPLRYWVLDSACAFPFAFNPPTTNFYVFFF